MFVVPSVEQKTPLDAFMNIPLEDVYQFGQASTYIRMHLQLAEGVLIEPLRGAAPLDWSARGLTDIESSPTDGMTVLQVPSGVGTHIRTDTGAERFGRLYRGVRKNIIRQSLSEIPDDIEGITVLDEVQLGGTVTRMANMCVGYALEHQIPLPVQVISGEAIEALSEQRDRYKRLLAGVNPNIRVSPVRIPMIYGAETYDDAHNRALVPNVIYTYDYEENNRKLRDIEVVDNKEAELLFRMIGSMSRFRALGRDLLYVLSQLDAMPRLASTEDTRAWAGVLVEKFRQ